MSTEEKTVDNFGMESMGWDRIPFDMVDKKVTDLMDFTGQKVVITGAGGVGLGIALSHRFAALGADLVMTDINPAVNDLAKEVAEKYGVKTYPIVADLMKFDQVQALFKEANEKLGRIDILINNATFTRYGNFYEFTEEEINDTITGAFTSVAYCCRCVADYMIPQKAGKIINISSESSFDKNNQSIVLYGASKSGVNGLTRGLAYELGQFGITVNGVAPALMFHTQLQEVFKNPVPETLGVRQLMAYGAQSTLLKRASLPEEVANTVVFLCSDACSYIDGQTISNGGGLIV